MIDTTGTNFESLGFYSKPKDLLAQTDGQTKRVLACIIRLSKSRYFLSGRKNSRQSVILR